VPYPAGDTVTLLRETLHVDIHGAPVRDVYGNDQLTTTNITVTGCVVWPRGSSEKTGNHDLVSTGITVLMPTGTVVKSTDRVQVAGVIYDVDGEPAEWRSPFTNLHSGVQVDLVRVTG
jgi:hypothetical protein